LNTFQWRSALRTTDSPAARLGFSEADVAALASAVDTDRDGRIDYAEFASYFRPARAAGRATAPLPPGMAEGSEEEEAADELRRIQPAQHAAAGPVGEAQGEEEEDGRYRCEHCHAFAGSYRAVEDHEALCVANPVRAAAYSTPYTARRAQHAAGPTEAGRGEEEEEEDGRYRCEHCHAFNGAYEEVEDHEALCAANPARAGGDGGIQRQYGSYSMQRALPLGAAAAEAAAAANEPAAAADGQPPQPQQRTSPRQLPGLEARLQSQSSVLEERRRGPPGALRVP
jgi:hypothetical protein